MDHRPAPPLSARDWLRALPWLLLVEFVYLLPYCFRPGGAAAKYIWDEHCVDHTYPAAWLARSEAWSGFFPLWNPYSGAGLPLAANTLDESLLPYAIVKYLLPFPAGLNVYLAIKLLLALTGAFALARELSSSRAGAILAAVIYGFTGFITLNFDSVIGTIFVLPWPLFFLRRLATRPRLASVLGTAVSFGVLLGGGNPQTPFQALLIGVALYLFTLWMRSEVRSVGRWLLLPGGAIGLGVALSGQQLLPVVEYLARAFSHHLPGYGLWHLDPRGAVGVMFPLWDPAIALMSGHGIGPLQDFFRQAFPVKDYAAATIPIPFEYLGAAAVLFLIFALLNLRRLPASASLFAAMAVFCLGQAYGLFPFSLLSRVPPFNQMSNWRFTTFAAALACSVLAGQMLTRMARPAFAPTIVPALAILAGLSAAGMALIGSQAGLPLTSLPIVGPLAAAAVVLAALGAALWRRRPGLVVAVAFLELFAYDRAADHPLFPHPHRVLAHPEAVTACAPLDPAFRFQADGEVIKPSLGILLGPRYDLRSYEMIFPDTLVNWFEAANHWTRRDTVVYYLTHYYFALTPAALGGDEAGKASVRHMLAADYLPPGEMSTAQANARVLAPGREYVKPLTAVIAGASRQAILQHSPSRVEIRDDLAPGRTVAGFAALAPWAWDPERGDGVMMELTAPAAGGSEGRLLYARYLDPRHRPDERAWLPFAFASRPGLTTAVLPGPRNDARSDFALWADFHDPQARADFERRWRLRDGGTVKCYEDPEALPRLRVAKAVEVTDSYASCLRGIREGGSPAGTETVVDTNKNWEAGRGRIEKVQWGTNRIDAAAVMEAAGTVVLADTWYPGWTAWIDGEPTPIRPANCAFRAIAVPAGTHEISFRFIPHSFRLGLAVGIWSWMVFLVLAFWNGKGKSVR
jgi:hypothetical protein